MKDLKNINYPINPGKRISARSARVSREFLHYMACGAKGLYYYDNCGNCSTKTILDTNYDAYYCPTCNMWKEPKCAEENCYFCTARPERPINENT